jgi:hypothetical protein
VRFSTAELFHSMCLDWRSLLAHGAIGRGVCSVCLEFAQQQRAEDT